MEKLTENEVIELLIKWLEDNNWEIKSYCLDNKRGNDIEAIRDGKTLIVEAKGAKANDNSKIKKRDFFSSGQIKTHFGKAIVKLLEEKVKYPDSLFAIASPYDKSIIKATAKIVPLLKGIDIIHIWVHKNGNIEIENENTQHITLAKK